MAALGTCERGRGARELRKASNDKNTTQHHYQVSERECVSESSSGEGQRESNERNTRTSSKTKAGER